MDTEFRTPLNTPEEESTGVVTSEKSRLLKITYREDGEDTSLRYRDWSSHCTPFIFLFPLRPFPGIRGEKEVSGREEPDRAGPFVSC